MTQAEVRVKICGLTRSEDAALALRLGAWALGFIFYEKSPRYVSPEAVAEILGQLSAQGLRPAHAVGVFVNSSAAAIRDVVRRSGIDTVQLHGDESSEFAAGLSDLRVFKAFRLRTADDLASSRFAAFADHAAAFLFDAAVVGHYGGSGQTSDWDLVARVPPLRPLILSGGLNPDNVGAALKRLAPYALDLSSGVEVSPGVKDPLRLEKLFHQLGIAYAEST